MFVTLNTNNGVVIGSHLRGHGPGNSARVVEILFANVFSYGQVGRAGGQATEIRVVEGWNFEGIV
jgi:hypothetical protein